MRNIIRDTIGSIFKDVERKKSKRNLEKIISWDNEDMIIFDINDILFFSTESNKTVLLTIKGKYKEKEGLDDLQDKLTVRLCMLMIKKKLLTLLHLYMRILHISP